MTAPFWYDFVGTYMTKRHSDLINEIESLPEEALPELEVFLKSLKSRFASRKADRPPVKLAGLLKDLNLRITEEESAAARKEMWGKFAGGDPGAAE